MIKKENSMVHEENTLDIDNKYSSVELIILNISYKLDDLYPSSKIFQQDLLFDFVTKQD